MKLWLLVIFTLVLGGCGLVGSTPPSPQVEQPKASTSVLGLSLNEERLKVFSVGNQTYRTTWALIDHETTIEVGVNESLASSSNQIRSINTCSTLTSGGFYGKNDLPIGMVVSSGVELSPWQENQLFNGILSSNKKDFSIQKASNGDYEWALQAGPVLFFDGKPALLNLKNDQRARRIIAGITQEGKLLLAVVVAADGLFDGPMLADMPEVVQKLEEVAGVKFVSAINLDGGTASAFVSDNVTLKELKPIGSWICVR